MEGLARDLRFALRSLRRQPALTLVVVATLALGIGANVAIFSVLHAVLLRPLPFDEPEELVTLWQDYSARGGPVDEWFSWDNFTDARRASESLESMVAIAGWRPTLLGEGAPEQLQGAQASASLFEVLGVGPAIGRAYGAEEDRAEGERVVLLGDGLWNRRFGADPGVVGGLVELDGERWRVVGVLPPAFEVPFVGQPEIVKALRIDESNSCGRGCVNLRVVGRLAEGASVAQARDEMASIARRLEEEYPDANVGIGSWLVPLHERTTGTARTPLLLLLGAVGLVLLIACANVAGLQLTRALGRRGEFAVRTALGAGRVSLIRQLLVESLTLSLVGGLVGLAVAAMALVGLRRLAADGVPRLAEATLDVPTLLFALVVTALTGLLFGALPALRAARFDLRSGIAEGDSAGGGVRTRRLLVVAEVALATLLLVGAGLVGRSLYTLFQLDLGYDTERVLVARVPLAGEEYRERERKVAFTEAVLERLRAMPGIVAASHTNSPPLLGNDGDSSFAIEGRPEAEPGEEPVAWIRVVEPEFFRTAGVRISAGRGFESGDREGAPDVVLVNETAARRFFPDSDALGERVNFNSTVRWREVVGVVADTRHFGLTEPARPAVYFPWAQSPSGSPYFLVQTEGEPLARSADLRAAVAEVDPRLPVAEITTFDELVGNASRTERLLVTLLGLFAGVALLLAAIGLYGVMSHAVTRRRRELGIRLALGADGGTLRAMVLRQGLVLALVGIGLGLLAGAGLGRVLEGVLYATSPWDLPTYASVPLVLLAVSVLALWLPARRASRAEVVEALRHE